jgi:hypothetical protein
MSQIRRRSFVVLLPGIAAAVTRAAHAAPAGALVLVGTYTGPKSEGIYAFRFDPATGALTPQGLAARTESPAFLARHPREPWVFAVNEARRSSPGTRASRGSSPSTRSARSRASPPGR